MPHHNTTVLVCYMYMQPTHVQGDKQCMSGLFRQNIWTSVNLDFTITIEN